MTLRIFLHDAAPAKDGEPHGEDGLTHAATVKVDYPYQVEAWVHNEIQPDYPHIVRVRCPELSREWVRGPDAAFHEVPRAPSAQVAQG
jgi:hypothetical protein